MMVAVGFLTWITETSGIYQGASITVPTKHNHSIYIEITVCSLKSFLCIIEKIEEGKLVV